MHLSIKPYLNYKLLIIAYIVFLKFISICYYAPVDSLSKNLLSFVVYSLSGSEISISNSILSNV